MNRLTGGEINFEILPLSDSIGRDLTIPEVVINDPDLYDEEDEIESNVTYQSDNDDENDE